MMADALIVAGGRWLAGLCSEGSGAVGCSRRFTTSCRQDLFHVHVHMKSVGLVGRIMIKVWVWVWLKLERFRKIRITETLE